MTPRRLILIAAAALPLAATATPAPAQADYSENFENNGADGPNGPSNLVSAGWIFRNQCVPVNEPVWFDGDGFGGAPFDGSGYLAADSMATDWNGGEYSVWAILPAIPGQQNGEEFSIWIVGGGSPTYDTFLEVRYAPAGTSTGSGPDGVGDFTNLLISVEMPISAQGYQRISATLPGPGRVGLRVRADYMMTFVGNGFALGVDALTVGQPQGDPCGVPIPDPGETVTWTAADSPFIICQDLLIPGGGTVIIEPGAIITFNSGSSLRVEGALHAHGTLSDEITFNGSTGFNDGLNVSASGEADIAFADINTRILGGGENAVLIVRDSHFSPSAVISGTRDLAIIDRCTFDGGGLPVLHSLNAGAVRITDSFFSDGASAQLIGYTFLNSLDIDTGQLRLFGDSVAHPVFVDNVTVTGYPSDAGIALEGPNFLFGDNVTLANNLYTLRISGIGAGILPGSELPTSGNANNYILADALYLAFNRHWANTGPDYLVAANFPQNYGGALIIEPGTTVRFGPGAGAFIIDSAELRLEGTREEPIVLESAEPFNRWFGLKWVDDFDAKANHTIFDGGQITVQSDGGAIDLMNSTVRNSLEGTASVTGGIVRLHNTKIIDNQVGMVTTASGIVEADGSVSPSIFEGNAIAIDYNNTHTFPYLRFNWWGHPTGPTNPLHPSGQGDVVQDVHPAAFTPFLTSPPPQDDDFPVVTMMPVYFTAQPGDKIILRWASSDDHAVVAQRVEFADHDLPFDFETVATLPPEATTYEFTVPLVEPNNLYPTPSAIRIVAVDSVGQEAWDKSVLRVPYQEDWTVTAQDIVTPPDSHPGDNINICWGPTGYATAYIAYDNTDMTSYHGGSTAGCLPIGAGLPLVSTDNARVIIITTFGAGGRIHYSFSDIFEIRPDPRFGDAPPAIEVTSPHAGSAYPGAGTLPVRWTASDDDELRAFHVQASFDAGRTWHYMAMDLPADARAFDWDLPTSTGIADVRVRVVAIDRRFQDSSDTSGAFVILAGDGCSADFNGDGTLDFFDVADFLDAFSAQDPTADLTTDTLFDFFDVQEFLAAFSAGCP